MSQLRHKTQNRMDRHLVLLTAAGLFTATVHTAKAGIVTSTGAATVIPAPSTVRNGEFEHDTVIYVFQEPDWKASGISFDSSLDIASPGTYPGPVGEDQSPGTIPSETPVHSYYVHFDKVGSANLAHSKSGGVTLDEEILGVVVRTDNLFGGNNRGCLLGCSEQTRYPSFPFNYGLEIASSGDLVTLSDDRRTVTFTLSITGDDADNLRIITRAAAASNNPPSNPSGNPGNPSNNPTGNPTGNSPLSWCDTVGLGTPPKVCGLFTPSCLAIVPLLLVSRTVRRYRRPPHRIRQSLDG